MFDDVIDVVRQPAVIRVRTTFQLWCVHSVRHLRRLMTLQ
jgi:hypothetical protein